MDIELILIVVLTITSGAWYFYRAKRANKKMGARIGMGILGAVLFFFGLFLGRACAFWLAKTFGGELFWLIFRFNPLLVIVIIFLIPIFIFKTPRADQRPNDKSAPRALALKNRLWKFSPLGGGVLIAAAIGLFILANKFATTRLGSFIYQGRGVTWTAFDSAAEDNAAMSDQYFPEMAAKKRREIEQYKSRTYACIAGGALCLITGSGLLIAGGIRKTKTQIEHLETESHKPQN